jgi:hypothetical protein
MKGVDISHLGCFVCTPSKITFDPFTRAFIAHADIDTFFPHKINSKQNQPRFQAKNDKLILMFLKIL